MAVPSIMCGEHDAFDGLEPTEDSMRIDAALFAVVVALAPPLSGCDSGDADDPEADTAEAPSDSGGEAETGSEDGSSSDRVVADVRDVSVSGSAGDYTFEVTVESPDTGCGQYADWWEVVSTDGELLHRRILAHSHTDEQPFTRSGGPVEIDASETVVVRAHMSADDADAGYGGRAMRGSPTDGFEEADLEEGFAADLEDESPQPDDCAF